MGQNLIIIQRSICECRVPGEGSGATGSGGQMEIQTEG